MNYKNGKIYKIESHLGDKIYIGSTTKQYLSQRFSQHRSDFTRWKSGSKVSHLSAYDVFEEYGLENCNIVLIEMCPCNSKDELHAREAHYIKLMNCVNKNIPCRCAKEWRHENKDAIKSYAINYYIDHKNELIESMKLYRQENSEKMQHKKKEYYQRKKDDILKDRKKYRNENAESIKQWKSEKYCCDCGSEVSKSHKSRHENSVKHIKYLNSTQHEK